MRVLLVEDDSAVRGLLSRFLRGLGHQVVAVGLAEEAMRRLGKSDFDVLMTDYELPDGTGVDLIRALKDSVGLKVIVMSGNLERISRKEVEGLTIHAFLPKPFDLREVSRLVG